MPKTFEVKVDKTEKLICTVGTRKINTGTC